MHLIRHLLLLVCLGLFSCDSGSAPDKAAKKHGDSQKKASSKQLSNAWFIDPIGGNDSLSGTTPEAAWKSITKINDLKLKPGATVIIGAGQHDGSLRPKAKGTTEKPVHILFGEGIHYFPKETAAQKAYFISNSCAAPEDPMPIGILVEDCEHLLIEGGGLKGDEQTTLMMQGRMVHFINDHSHHIRYESLTFDLERPTVSEFLVTTKEEGRATIQIAEGSTYKVENDTFTWTGDIGRDGVQVMMQRAIPAEGRSQRVSTKWTPFDKATKIKDLGENRVRLYFEDGFTLTPGHQYQFRKLFRDIVGGHNTRSSNITMVDCEFNALAGMGIISQFTENLTFKDVRVVPPKNTIRTCPAWADVLHFSGCAGQILVEDCVFSGTQDDPINVHGTHLRIVKQTAENQLMLRFAHHQTYGFAAFQPGDAIAIVNAKTLQEYPSNPICYVEEVERLSDTNWLITLDGPVPHFEDNDAIDNLTWYPAVTIRNCYVDMNSCRGFLLTTRRKVIVEGNTLHRCRMPGILIEGDASGWHESGPIRDMTIQNNTFIGQGIDINPRVEKGDAPYHKNIRILNNTFKEGAGIKAHHTQELFIKGNTTDGDKLPINIAPNCGDVFIEE